MSDDAEKSPLLCILVDRQAIPVTTEGTGLFDWLAWISAARESGECVVQQQHVGPFFVSTVFTGICRNAGPFQTLTFNAHGLPVASRHYETWADAVAGHEAMTTHAWAESLGLDH